jgi:tetratricopeptide (TPR) repeat protein
MKIFPLFLIMTLALPLRAQEDFSVRPLGGVVDAPAEPAAIDTGGETLGEESAAVEEMSAPVEKKPAPAPKVTERKVRGISPLPAPTRVAVQTPEHSGALLDFLSESFSHADKAIYPSLLAQTEDWLNTHRGNDGAENAQALKARILDAQKAYLPALVAWMKLVYEYPEAGDDLGARSRIERLAKKKLKKQREQVLALAKAPEGLNRPERLIAMLRGLSEIENRNLYAALVPEFHEFLRRYPTHPAAGEMTLQLATWHDFGREPEAAVLLAQRVTAIYTRPALLAEAQAFMGDVYAGSLKDYDRAMAAYQVVTDKFEQSEEAGSAYVKMARILDKNLKQPNLAIEVLKKIVARYPKTDAAHDALRDESRIFAKKLKDAGRAVESLEAVADMFGGERAVEALTDAAKVAGGSKDYARQVQLYERLAKNYPEEAAAPKALWDAGQVYERHLEDVDTAKQLYQQIVSKYPSGRLAKKAGKRIAKLEAE